MEISTFGKALDVILEPFSLFLRIIPYQPCSFPLSIFSLSFFMVQGNHLLKHDRSILGKTCGILPFGIGGYSTSDSPDKSLTGVKVKTKGLEWDLGKF